MAEKENPMKEIIVEKVTVNMGVGEPGQPLENAKKLLENLSGRNVVETTAKKRNPTFRLRKGLPIGVKTTLRGEGAVAFLEKALAARKKVLSESNFDKRGNFAFGIKEYIDFPGAKYDPSIGMLGFDVCVTLGRRGSRIKKRALNTAKEGRGHVLSKEEAIEFAKSKLDVNLE
ncbi:50S ribosomal protein L5 [Candidatus Micrarchaeota archaeon]|nr:50S ribosomal protein L5 [Candidatus Micrarchaeota archaeon]